MPVMIIERSCEQRSFDRKSGAELGFDYRHNFKAWMNKDNLFSGGSSASKNSSKGKWEDALY